MEGKVEECRTLYDHPISRLFMLHEEQEPYG
jgi:hypothetical protein